MCGVGLRDLGNLTLTMALKAEFSTDAAREGFLLYTYVPCSASKFYGTDICTLTLILLSGLRVQEILLICISVCALSCC